MWAFTIHAKISISADCKNKSPTGVISESYSLADCTWKREACYEEAVWEWRLHYQNVLWQVWSSGSDHLRWLVLQTTCQRFPKRTGAAEESGKMSRNLQTKINKHKRMKQNFQYSLQVTLTNMQKLNNIHHELQAVHWKTSFVPDHSKRLLSKGNTKILGP